MPARIVISADGKKAYESWHQALAAVAPDLDVCSWYDPAWEVGRMITHSSGPPSLSIWNALRA